MMVLRPVRSASVCNAVEVKPNIAPDFHQGVRMPCGTQKKRRNDHFSAVLRFIRQRKASGMIEIILTVCAVANPANCEEKYLQFDWDGSIKQCVMAAQPYIAEWIGRHPEWVATKWSCDYPGHEKQKI
jgi:hypothetical protein